MEILAPNDRFFGRSKPVLDAKNRVTIPAMWRSVELPGLYAFFDQEDGAVWLFDRTELVRMGQNAFRTEGVSLEDARAFREHLYTNSMECPLDAQGRILLPGEFVAMLGLEKEERELVMVGKGPRIEVWPSSRFGERAPASQAGFARSKRMMDL